MPRTPTTPTSRAETLTQLDAVETAMREQHPDNPARLEQLASHLATCRMVVDHLYDEAETG